MFVAAVALDIANTPVLPGPDISMAGAAAMGALSKAGAMSRGKASEARVLKEMGLSKNTTKVSSSEGKSIPDALSSTKSVEIKDTKSVCCDKQVRIQTDAAKASGRESVLVTGTKTEVNDNAKKAFDRILRRDDLGPE